ncbi:MAG: tRNA glutamyl-Q(34) synthetase GluQRS [Thermoleophilia bacterium]|nr:tRNA glutamyl-Q(34) synthetase GluQRS [Thermoleophilia bacterium]
MSGNDRNAYGAEPGQYDGRYAPSPTGDLHLGNLRTALAAWSHARVHAARFVIRIDDLDPERVREGIAARQLADLAALGIDWDDAPLVQSTRRAAHEAALEQLSARSRTYPCFCTRADIRAAASAPHGASTDGAYGGTCAQIAETVAAARIAQGEPYALRVRADAALVAFEDELLGPLEATVDDFVVRRKDGVAAYNLATVVDDAAQHVGQVVRGADLADTTPRQIWLARQLGLPPVRYAHVPIVRGADMQRLAKRHGSVSLADLALRGISAAEVRRVLLESLSASDELTDFQLAAVSRADQAIDPARFTSGARWDELMVDIDLP